MLRPLLTLGLAAALFTVSANAQCNANLAVTGSGQAGTTLTFDLTGATPNSFALLMVGTSSATRTVTLGPLGSVTILAPPAVPVPLGMTDAGGNASLSFDIPAVPSCLVLYGQGLTVGFDFSSLPPSFSACNSNVAQFSVGC